MLWIIETQYSTGHAACSRCVVNQSRAAPEEGGSVDGTGAGGLSDWGFQLNARHCEILLEDAPAPLGSDRG